MQSLRAFEKNGEKYTLRDSIELLALEIVESLCEDESHQTEWVLQKCHILNSLVEAYNSIKA